MDLGLYYRGTLDVAALGRLAREVAGPNAAVTAPGQWGPWVDGGGWLRINGTAVDWIYRELDRVQHSWREAREGRFSWHFQPGHPLGLPSFAYAGEAALAVVLVDVTGELSALHRAARTYPPRLRDAVVASLWEAEFMIDGARKAVVRGDSAYVAGCLFRALLLCSHALHATPGVGWSMRRARCFRLDDCREHPRRSVNESMPSSPPWAAGRTHGAPPWTPPRY